MFCPIVPTKNAPTNPLTWMRQLSYFLRNCHFYVLKSTYFSLFQANSMFKTCNLWNPNTFVVFLRFFKKCSKKTFGPKDRTGNGQNASLCSEDRRRRRRDKAVQSLKCMTSVSFQAPMVMTRWVNYTIFPFFMNSKTQSLK